MQSKVGKISCFSVALLGSTLFAEEAGYWEFLTDFVYMERYHVQNQTLTIDSSRCIENCTATLDVKELASGFGFEPGLHVGLGYVVDPRASYEGDFLYVWDWENTKTRTSDASALIVPFQDPTFVRNFFHVSEVQAFYKSQFYTAQLNFEKAFSPARLSYLSLSGVGGLRFASLKEKFTLTAFEVANFAEYDIKTTNNLIGIQIGFAFQINAMKFWHWDLDGKVGVGLNRISADTFLGDKSNTVELRNFSKLGWQSNIFAEASAGGGFRPFRNLDIHAGYAMLYFCGLALAPDQIDNSSRTSSLTIDRNGYVIVHGIYAGVNFSF